MRSSIFDFWNSHEIYFWELVVTARKACMIAISVFLATFGAEIQVFVGIFVLVFFLGLHLHYNPYEIDNLNRLETGSKIYIFYSQNLEDGNHEMYLQSDLSLPCYDGIHYVMLVFIGLPSFLVYVLGFPLGTYIVLYKNRKNWMDDSVMYKYGMLMAGYR